MKELNIATRRGAVLYGVLFDTQGADTVVIAITGIHGNFYSNPFYYNFGDTLNAGGIDFIYAQTNDAFGVIQTMNTHTGKEETIGSWNERFVLTDEDIEVSANGTSRGGIRAGLNEAYFLDAAKLLAERVKVPVVLVGGLRSMEKINKILNETNIAYISLSRPLIREPNLINRWQQGDTTPSKCVSCNSCYRTLGHRCVFN